MSHVAYAAALWWLRLFALLVVQIPWLRVLGPLWVVVAGALAAAIAGALALVAAPPELASLGAAGLLHAAVLEVIFGGALGVVVGLPGHALLGAAAASGRGLGLRRGALEPLILALTLSLGLSLGLHRPLLFGLRALALAAPPGDGALGLLAALAGGLTPAAIAGAAAELLILALALATPVLLTRAVLTLATALVAAPGRPLGVLGPWIASAAAALALCASWSAYPDAWLRALQPAAIAAR
ncbi:MAG: hypothetical protein R3A79_24075 [Nannocystaceae bacterium]